MRTRDGSGCVPFVSPSVGFHSIRDGVTLYLLFKFGRKKKMKKGLFCVALIVSAVCACGVALATSNTTHQQWDFSTSGNPAYPDVVNNDFGSPVITLPSGTWLSTYGGASGVWRFTAISEMSIAIPNTGNTAPNTQKEISLQVTYKDPAGAGEDLPITVIPAYDSIGLITREILSNGYFHDTYKIIITPNPASEVIDIFTIQCTLYVDQIIVDTICIPEPATIAILSLGGLLLRRKK